LHLTSRKRGGVAKIGELGAPLDEAVSLEQPNCGEAGRARDGVKRECLAVQQAPEPFAITSTIRSAQPPPTARRSPEIPLPAS